MRRTAAIAWKEIEQKLAKKLRKLPPIIGEEVVNFSLRNFEQQAWSGYSQQPWKRRKPFTKWGKKDEADRALLKKSKKGYLSIRVSRVENYKVWVSAGGPDVPYMVAHNYGFRGVVHQNVRAFTRKMKDGSIQEVKAFSRTIHQNIPRRQFIGGTKESPYLKALLNRTIKAELRTIFK